MYFIPAFSVIYLISWRSRLAIVKIECDRLVIVDLLSRWEGFIHLSWSLCRHWETGNEPPVRAIFCTDFQANSWDFLRKQFPASLRVETTPVDCSLVVWDSTLENVFRHMGSNVEFVFNRFLVQYCDGQVRIVWNPETTLD
jgi:hypothetical protein